MKQALVTGGMCGGGTVACKGGVVGRRDLCVKRLSRPSAPSCRLLAPWRGSPKCRRRMDESAHEILESEDSPIDTLRRGKFETEPRRFVTNWLRNTDRGLVCFTQEAVIVVENRTDIRLQPRAMEVYAAIELKPDDTRGRWSGCVQGSCLS